MLFQDRKLRQAALFYAIAFGLTFALTFVAPLIGRGVLFIMMFSPAVSVIVCRLVSPEGRRFSFAELGLSRLGLRHWPFALIVPLVVLLPGYFLVWGTGIATLAPMTEDTNLVRVVVSFAVSIVLGSTLGALGEEVGWRGYMLPRLVDALGERKAGWLTGFLHGLWHVPVILLTPFYHSDAPALFIVPLFMVLITLSGPIFAHLRIASGSIVPVALMHHAWNGYWETLASATTGENTELIVYLTGESGIASIVMMSLVVLWLSRRAPVGRRLPAAS